MADKQLRDDYLETLMSQLADSVLPLSDQAIFDEVNRDAAVPHDEAERTRAVLRNASETVGSLNGRLSSLGHTINSKFWRSVNGEYHNNCLVCGSVVSFKTSTGEMRGRALSESCSEIGQESMGKRENIG